MLVCLRIFRHRLPYMVIAALVTTSHRQSCSVVQWTTSSQGTVSEVGVAFILVTPSCDRILSQTFFVRDFHMGITWAVFLLHVRSRPDLPPMLLTALVPLCNTVPEVLSILVEPILYHRPSLCSPLLSPLQSWLLQIILPIKSNI